MLKEREKSRQRHQKNTESLSAMSARAAETRKREEINALKDLKLELEEKIQEPYDVMPFASLIAAAEDAVSEGAENADLVTELLWRIKNEDNRDPKITALGSYYRFPPEDEGTNNE